MPATESPTCTVPVRAAPPATRLPRFC